MDSIYQHQPVMAEEVLSFFKNCQGKTLVDATAGGGGHLQLLARAVGDKGQVFAFDKDARAHQEDAALGVVNKFPQVIKLFCLPFSQIKSHLANIGIDKVDGLICDLGVSSHQLDDQTRGFSFLHDGPIDMRMDKTSGFTAYQWLKDSSEEEIAHALFTLGGERKSRVIAKRIKALWPIDNSTQAFAKLVLSAIRPRAWSKTHPATRTFQAIRMVVNQELLELSSLLTDLPELLAPNGIAVFLSFHSGEDRLIKNAFKHLANLEQPSFKILTKKPLLPTKEEITRNRRARSAKLRAIMRVS